MKYTQKQRELLHKLYTSGLSWDTCAEKFNTRYKTTITWEAARSVVRRFTPEKKVINTSIDHFIVPDTQIQHDVPLHHLSAAGKLINDRQPKKVIILGDWWDMASLSSYEGAGSKSVEGKRIQKDIDIGNKGMDMFMKEIKYNPEIHFIMGNHEKRIGTAINTNPKLDGLLSYDLLDIPGTCHKFLKIVTLEGVAYSHYFANPMTGKPVGGAIQSMLKNLGFSFIQGHKQCFNYDRRDLTNGLVQHGMIAGAFHIHNEHYKGEQGSNHWRGLVHLHDVKDGDYDHETISMNRLLKTYGGK